MGFPGRSDGNSRHKITNPGNSENNMQDKYKQKWKNDTLAYLKTLDKDCQWKTYN